MIFPTFVLAFLFKLWLIVLTFTSSPPSSTVTFGCTNICLPDLSGITAVLAVWTQRAQDISWKYFSRTTTNKDDKYLLKVKGHHKMLPQKNASMRDSFVNSINKNDVSLSKRLILTPKTSWWETMAEMGSLFSCIFYWQRYTCHVCIWFVFYCLPPYP